MDVRGTIQYEKGKTVLTEEKMLTLADFFL